MSKIHDVVESGMTVADLIEELQMCDPDAQVVFACDYGDITHTMQALPVETIDEASTLNLYKSAYSSSEVAVFNDDPNDYTEEDEDDALPVVILS
jgi:hypothetical protein